jgi:hypothetical protein
MKIHISQAKFAEIKNDQFDLIIAASGFEKRAAFQIPQISDSQAQKIALAFNNEKDDNNRLNNDAIFRAHGFTLIEADGSNLEIEFLRSIFRMTPTKRRINVYVDYSCMTRNWYAQILLFATKFLDVEKANFFFGYSVAEYEYVAKEEKLNEIVEPIFGFCKLSIPSKPTALVICLGNEISRVYGLREFFDATTYLFYSDTKFGNKFSYEVEDVNYDILASTPNEHIFKYPLEDLVYTSFLIESLCRSLNENYRVILAPCGPKTFTLLSLINSLKLNTEIEVWRISPGKSLQKLDRAPNGQVLLLNVCIEK